MRFFTALLLGSLVGFAAASEDGVVNDATDAAVSEPALDSDSEVEQYLLEGERELEGLLGTDTYPLHQMLQTMIRILSTRFDVDEVDLAQVAKMQMERLGQMTAEDIQAKVESLLQSESPDLNEAGLRELLDALNLEDMTEADGI
ncbi:hypothetical protein BESB_014560 [Besnoitia besnoiti]|uniref:Uncharacterized protein n=1 Tax=Besnoitia besnoiti TaxID=94643 RepID=A0A2A9MAY5_BESBE|nr:hypothetical protein BESB_014560 [Besnoitia besnoiti]PFH32843.1 hypothetical protein BESB_014560 [Besnoitia besnoiti]